MIVEGWDVTPRSISLVRMEQAPDGCFIVLSSEYVQLDDDGPRT